MLSWANFILKDHKKNRVEFAWSGNRKNKWQDGERDIPRTPMSRRVNDAILGG
jgi:hypothetical protein